MSYYKLIYNGEIVDAINVETAGWLVENPRSLSIYTGNEADAKGVLSSDGQTTWHIDGRDAFVDYPNLKTARLETIDETEYNEICAELEAGRSVTEPTSNNEPEHDESSEVKAAKTRMQILEGQVSELLEQNAMLTECLLEMSEIVYGE